MRMCICHAKVGIKQNVAPSMACMARPRFTAMLVLPTPPLPLATVVCHMSLVSLFMLPLTGSVVCVFTQILRQDRHGRNCNSPDDSFVPVKPDAGSLECKSGQFGRHGLALIQFGQLASASERHIADIVRDHRGTAATGDGLNDRYLVNARS